MKFIANYIVFKQYDSYCSIYHVEQLFARERGKIVRLEKKSNIYL